MGSRLMGVALAAAASMCALAVGLQRAEAATVNIKGLSQLATNNAFSFDITYDPLDRFNATATFNFYAGGSTKDRFTDTKSHAEVKRTYSYFGITGFNFTFSNPQFAYSYDDFDDRDDTYTHRTDTGYTFSGSFEYYSFPDQTFLSDVIQTPFGFGASASEIPISDGTVISTVPLPASLPLFGAGLLALGGVAFARRRAALTAPLRLPS